MKFSDVVYFLIIALISPYGRDPLMGLILKNNGQFLTKSRLSLKNVAHSCHLNPTHTYIEKDEFSTILTTL